jgi:flagellar basal-body rod protein FlgG
MSNVDLTEEMTELISTQRLIQSQGKAISFADDMMGLVNTIRG